VISYRGMNATLLTAATLIALALAAPAMAQDLPAIPSETQACTCVENSCNNACIRKPNPEVVAALRKRFRDLDESDIMVLYDGQGGFDVVFWTTDAHRACHLKLKPLKITKCRQVHA
jgi:hypothetical protein